MFSADLTAEADGGEEGGECFWGCAIQLSEATILVVDDEPALREIFAKWLQVLGCGRVLTAEDGRAALDVFEREPTDLLITDVRMPVMDGVDLVRSLVEKGKPMPSIVFVSGYGDFDMREMYALGVYAFISKPFEREELLGALERGLSKRTRLWLERMEVAPRQSMVMEAAELGKSTEEGVIGLGRGGFSARYEGSLSLSKVAFRCRISSIAREITGEGYVRWSSREDKAVGIEFAYLDEPCRSWVLDEIEAACPVGFIPR